jgi:syringate O-demethylase
MHPFDRVVVGGRTAGLSTWIGYSANEAKMLSLAIVDVAHAKPGTRVSLVWGEQNGGSAKPTVERHVQTEITATVSPVPYSEVARDSYAAGWRTRELKTA